MSMSCEKISTLLWRRIDSEELSASDAQSLDSHLGACATCSADLALFERQDAVISAAFSDFQINDQLNDTIIKAVAKERANGAPSIDFSGRIWAFAPIAAAALVLAWLMLGAPNTDSSLSKTPVFVSMAAAKGNGLRVLRNKRWVKMKAGANVRKGEIIQNRTQSPTTIEFKNKTRVTLRSNTTTKITQGADGATEIDLTAGSGGEILCEVTPGYGAFRVRAYDMEVSVIGTKFLVRSFQGLTRVVVLEGKVRCESKNSQSLLVARQEAELRKNDSIIVSSSVLEKRTHWLVPKKGPAVTQQTDPVGPKPTESPQQPVGPEKPSKTNPGKPNPGLDLPVIPPKRNGVGQVKPFNEPK
jgi:hypothetical protein